MDEVEQEAATGPRRARPVMKGVYFTAEEWAQVAAMMETGGARSVSDFIREMTLRGKVVVNERVLDVMAVRAVLAPIGNNLNQIARKVNVDDYASLEQVEAARALLARVEQVLNSYVRGE